MYSILDINRQCFCNRHMIDNTDNQFPEFDKNGDGKVTLEEYHQTTLGEIEG